MSGLALGAVISDAATERTARRSHSRRDDDFAMSSLCNDDPSLGVAGAGAMGVPTAVGGIGIASGVPVITCRGIARSRAENRHQPDRREGCSSEFASAGHRFDLPLFAGHPGGHEREQIRIASNQSM